MKLIAAEAVDVEEAEPERQHHRHADKDEEPQRVRQDEEIARKPFPGPEGQAPPYCRAAPATGFGAGRPASCGLRAEAFLKRG